MTTVKPIKFGLIGHGHIGKRHALMIKHNPETQLLAICDIKAKEELELHDFGGRFYGQYQDMLQQEPELDIVIVATPNGLHEEHALAILDAGKHVVIEKPMALTKAGCEAIIFKSLKMSRQVFCVMQNRYSPPSIWLKDLVEKGILGDIYMVQVNCFWNRDERYYRPGSWRGTKKLDGGTLFTQFSHFVDILYWLFGDITDISGKFSDFSHQDSTDFEDSGFVNFRFTAGGMGSINYSTAVWKQNLESSLTILAEKGAVKIGGQYMNKVEICEIEQYEMPELAASNPPNDYGYYKGSAANHIYVLENVVETLKGENTITTNAMEGLKVVEIIERIYQIRNNKESFSLKKRSHP
ncbi:MAG: Gfo/Idh/MocA family oxidoreductase [Bacteroidota bacterium]